MKEGSRSAAGTNRPTLLLLAALAPLAGGSCALIAGQDANWDLRNYHYYIGFAQLNARLGFDVAVSHVATWYNPALYVPFYWAAAHLAPPLVGFLLSALAGLNALPLLLIARECMKPDRGAGAGGGDARRTAVARAAVVLAGLLGAMNLSELGTSFADDILSVPILCALWLVLRFRARHALLAGLLCGATTGLKLPNAIFAVALFAALLSLRLPMRARVRAGCMYALGGTVGLLATDGYWMLEMWQRYQNPLFPYLNEFFHSAWAAAGSYRHEKFIPGSLAAQLAFPATIATDPLAVGEVEFRDWRFVTLYAVLGLLALRAAFDRLRGRMVPGAARSAASGTGASGAALEPAFVPLLVFIVVAFIAWMKLFAVYRYITVGEMLAPLAIWVGLARLCAGTRLPWWTPALALGIIVVAMRPADWGRRAWDSDYFGVTAPAIVDPAHAIVMMAGYEPMAYMIPAFGRGVRFLRVDGYATGPSATPSATDLLMRATIQRSTGPLYFLYRDYEEPRALAAAAFDGVEIRRAECVEFRPRVDAQPGHPFRLCRAALVSPPARALSPAGS